MRQAHHYPKFSQIARQERLLLTVLLSVMIVRMVAIAVTPLGFGVDEAQYWLWGQDLDFGYYSKPPLIGWYLGVMDALFGSSAVAARITAPILHVIISCLLYGIGYRFHSASAGRWAALLWISLPIVSLGSFVISTDTLLLVAWLAALGSFLQAVDQNQKRAFFVTGLLIGIGVLAKYAAIYFILGAALFLFTTPHRTLISKLSSWGLIALGACITSSPNLIWNFVNGGITFAHLGENADLAQPLYSFASAFEFILSQSAVIGPVSFVILCACLLRYRAVQTRLFLKLCLCFSLPVLAIMVGQAYLKTANANWAATAWPTACLLIAGVLSQKTPHRLISRFWGKLALSVNFFAAFFIALAVAMGDLGSLTPASDPLRRLRGWDQLATDVREQAQIHNTPIIIADRRAEAALLSWHLHDSPYQIKVLDEDGRPGSHFELRHALRPTDEGPFLILTGASGDLPKQFAVATGPVGESITSISANRTRHKRFFIQKSLF